MYAYHSAALISSHNTSSWRSSYAVCTALPYFLKLHDIIYYTHPVIYTWPLNSLKFVSVNGVGWESKWIFLPQTVDAFNSRISHVLREGSVLSAFQVGRVDNAFHIDRVEKCVCCFTMRKCVPTCNLIGVSLRLHNAGECHCFYFSPEQVRCKVWGGGQGAAQSHTTKCGLGLEFRSPNSKLVMHQDWNLKEFQHLRVIERESCVFLLATCSLSLPYLHNYLLSFFYGMGRHCVRACHKNAPELQKLVIVSFNVLICNSLWGTFDSKILQKKKSSSSLPGIKCSRSPVPLSILLKIRDLLCYFENFIGSQHRWSIHFFRRDVAYSFHSLFKRFKTADLPYLTISVGQECGDDLARSLWLRVARRLQSWVGLGWSQSQGLPLGGTCIQAHSLAVSRFGGQDSGPHWLLAAM